MWLRVWACALLLGAADASAHPIGYSALYAEVDGTTIDVSYDLHPPTLVDVLPVVDPDGDRTLDAGEALKVAPVVGDYLKRTVTVTADGAPCLPETPRDVRLAAATRLLAKLRYRCPAAPGTLTWTVDLFMEDIGGHTVLGRFRTPAAYTQHAFTADHRVLDLASAPTPVTAASGGVVAPSAAATPTAAAAPVAQAPEGAWALMRAFVREGFGHILSGADHILFVLSLALVARRPRDLGWAITAFTAAHSASLALVALDVVRVPARLAEPAIAFTIVWVAVENVRRADPPGRGRLAFLFGFLHGFGFGSALRDLGLPTGGVLPSLLGFNVGVELGQLLVITPVVAALGVVGRSPPVRRVVERGLSGGIAALGVLWFIDRLLDLRWMPW